MLLKTVSPKIRRFSTTKNMRFFVLYSSLFVLFGLFFPSPIKPRNAYPLGVLNGRVRGHVVVQESQHHENVSERDRTLGLGNSVLC